MVSDLLALQHKAQRITGAFFALVLAMALCGPAPAVLIGVVSVLVDSLRNRLAWHKVLTNLTVYAVIPLVVGLGIEALEGVTDIETNNLTFALVVFGAFVLANVLNFAMIAATSRCTSGIPVSRQVRQIFVPVLPSELASALLTVSVAVALPRDRARGARAARARPESSSSTCSASCCARSAGPRSSPRCSSACSRAWSRRSRCATA